MTDISFLPAEKQSQAQRIAIPWTRLLVVVLVAAAIGLGVHYGYQEWQAYQELQQRLAQRQAERQALQPVHVLQEQVGELEQELARLREIVRPYNDAVQVRDALLALNMSVPDDMILSTLRMDYDRRLSVTGRAANLTVIARFMVALEDTAWFGDFDVSFPQVLNIDEALPVHFELSGLLLHDEGA